MNSIRITPAIEKSMSWNSHNADYEQKDKSLVLLYGSLRLAVIICLIAAALIAGA